MDVTHEIPPHDCVRARSRSEPLRAFPAETVFLAVVDPGVGTARRGIAVEAGGYRFVAPDNGILTHFIDDHPSLAPRDLNAGLFRRGYP